MKMKKLALLAGFAIALVLFFEVAAHADGMDQSTKLTIDEPIAIPGQILSAGSYLLKVDQDDPDLVRIFNADRTRLYATLLTVATERREPSGNTVLVMAEQQAGKPEALRKWFYPGNTIGHEFVYSKQQEQQIAQDPQQTIEAGD
jgi:hypothetical protein